MILYEWRYNDSISTDIFCAETAAIYYPPYQTFTSCTRAHVNHFLELS